MRSRSPNPASEFRMSGSCPDAVSLNEASCVTKPFHFSDSEQVNSEANVDVACSTFTFNFDRVAETSAVSGASSPGEVLAAKILADGSCTSHQLLELSTLLPSETPTRSDGTVPDGRAFTTGAYYHCGTVGLRHNTRAYPCASRLLAALARREFPDLSFTSVGMFRDVRTRRHRDLRNLPGSLNGVAPLCSFRGGEVRVHHSGGPADLPVSLGPVTFDAKVEHETLDWTSGPRLVLVVFSVYGIFGISAPEGQILRSMGFALPVSPGDEPQSDVSVPVHSHTTSASTGAVSGVVLDVFAGDAAFCKIAHKAGFRALAFDLKPQRAQFPIQPIDITQVDERLILSEVISEHASTLVMVQFTIPCLSSFFTDATGSWDFAQRLVASIIELCRLCQSVDVPFSILHPATSRFWHMPTCAGFLAEAGGHWTTFDQCMHGGAQDRRAFWWASTDVFRPLQAVCSKDHKHGAQAVTSPQWPHLLWDRATELLLQRSGFAAGLSSLFGPPGRDFRPAMGKQSRKARPLVSEFCAYDAWVVPLRSDSHVQQLLRCYPKGSRVVRRKLVVWGSVRVCALPSVDLGKLSSVLSDSWTWPTHPFKPSESAKTKDFTEVCGSVRISSPSQSLETIWVGIPREPDDFLQRAVAAGHPKALLDVETDPQMSLLIDNLLDGGVNKPGKGLAEARRWAETRAHLEDDQVVSRKSWPGHVSQVLADKPTLLMDRLLAENDFPDRNLVKHMTQGFRLSGWVCRSGLFPFDPKPPASTLKSQLSIAKSRNTATLTKLAKQASDAVSERAWAETLEEVEKGWIEEDDEPDLSTTLIAKRFGLAQGSKVRVIDDCRACAFNLLAGIPEKYRLQGVEYLAAFLLRAMLDPRSEGVSISGRTLDLTAAYKQFAVHPLDRDVLRIGVKDTTSGRVRTFKVNSLPFGATGSVSSFLRCAAATWFLGSHALGIPWTNYFDDFPIFSRDEDCEITDEVAMTFLDILQIYFAREGRKATKFAKSFKALGLVIDLSCFSDGFVTIGHTKERGEELHSMITKILEANRLSHAEAESLRGRLHWYTSFLFGRRSAQALNVLSDWVNRGASKGALSDELRDSLSFLRDVSLQSEPLRISRSLQQSFLIFTDGSLEDSFACVGGILHDSQGTPLAFFSVKLDEASVARLYAHSSHPIYEIELLAVWTALTLWEQCIRDSYSVFYLDNEAARGALISARSSTLTGGMIVDSFMRLEDRSLCRPWFGRVPTHSNCADEPSRDSYQHLVAKGVRRDSLQCVWPF